MDKVARKFLEKTSSSFNNQLANSNALTHDADGKITGYRSNFNIVNGGGEVNFADVIGGYGAGLFGDVAYNTQADSDGTGFIVGAGFGKSGHGLVPQRPEEAGATGASRTPTSGSEQDAVPSLFSYSDIDYVSSLRRRRMAAPTSQASILRFDYVLLPNFQLTAKSHFINALDRSAIGREASTATPRSSATQLDAVLKF